ncbi:hypothetical protein N7520_008876 [Penicillium odoratum]|uniref:uncharacterized protein n=1 Tax=Penicillium odoratum TaxID=1167516 RepID=UPI002548C5FA|nr:uncharacterized protein N7520_008876 [Penicillium odoratum]KAJ5751959.1 hypothetical protein N7520_008876 [Penicillium odoratum]
MLPTFLAIGLAPLLVTAQLSGSVGPTTSYADKAKNNTCSVLDYGAVADNSTDIGPAISSAWDDCKNGGVVYIPPGDYALDSWVDLTGGSSCAINIDGILYRTGTDGGNMIYIEHTSDFELLSSTSKGAVQGFGYEYHINGSLSGPRILRLYEVTEFSVHDLALVDSPAFHFSMDTCENGEVYNMIIRGGDSGGLDGIDIWSTNIWVHDVEVSNKDECVTVKSPASNILVESIYCNWSGGCAMGSLGTDTNITNIHYRNIYTWSSNQMYMIKSNGGDGTVSNLLLENFIGHGNAYSLDIDQAWSSMDTIEGDGVQLDNITISNWRGTESDGAERGPIKVHCASGAPCTDVTIEDFRMWTEDGDYQANSCENAYGGGSCVKEGDEYTTYSTAVTVTAAPSGYSAPTMAADLSSGFATYSSIPIPAIPTSFYPGLTPSSALAGASVTSSSASFATSSSTPLRAIATTSYSSSALAGASVTSPYVRFATSSSTPLSAIPTTVYSSSALAGDSVTSTYVRFVTKVAPTPGAAPEAVAKAASEPKAAEQAKVKDQAEDDYSEDDYSEDDYSEDDYSEDDYSEDDIDECS